MLQDPNASWRAAVVLAMLGDEAAEPRLLEAVETREIGFAEDDPRHPRKCQRLAPNWLSALVFLRRCATSLTLDVLVRLASDPTLVHNARTSCALLCAALAGRLSHSDSHDAMVQMVLDRLLSTPAPNAVGSPQRPVVGPREDGDDSGIWYPVVIEDFRWQLVFAVAKAKLARGQDADRLIAGAARDPRRPVRRAFADLATQADHAEKERPSLAGDLTV
jgi:hypothetical protein